MRQRESDEAQRGKRHVISIVKMSRASFVHAVYLYSLRLQWFLIQSNQRHFQEELVVGFEQKLERKLAAAEKRNRFKADAKMKELTAELETHRRSEELLR